MLKNFLKIMWRSMLRNRMYSFINITGLAIGMVVAMLIGCWIWDELSYNSSHKNHDRIAKVMLNQTFGNEVATQSAIPMPLGNYLRNTYPGDFRRIILSSWNEKHAFSYNNNVFSEPGSFMEPEATEMLSLKMIKGQLQGLTERNSILLSETVARAIFGSSEPIGKQLKIDNKLDVTVKGVYEDIAFNSSFRELGFIAPWDLYVQSDEGLKNSRTNWGSNSFQLFTELNPNADIEKLSAKIRNAVYDNYKSNAKPVTFLFPMSKWYLYSEFRNGKNTGGRIQFIWLFGLIGLFVLILACINFMNLSTASSEKRAREVGIRKVMGSSRKLLIRQFLSESFFMVFIAFVFSLALALISMRWFNELTDKQMSVPWQNAYFWLACMVFILITGFVSGSYPAFYLSSFQPVKVLKGAFLPTRLAAIPRKALVTLQFTVSITLIIGTIIVFQQIRYAKDRPVGYSRDRLIWVPTSDIPPYFESMRNELKQMGGIEEMAQSSSPTTGVWIIESGFNWTGKDPNIQVNFGSVACTYEFGKTVNWKIKEGRDFSRSFSTDSLAIIINESAARFMGFQNPVGERVKWRGGDYTVVGVIKDMVMDSPYEPVKPTVFSLNLKQTNDIYKVNFITIRIASGNSVSAALNKIESVFKKYDQSKPFDYHFNDQEYEQKFRAEERIGKLAGLFSILAIFISCLGIFGLALFMAEQRIKEIGIRKVLGATVLGVWRLLSVDFIRLVLIAFVIAAPLSYILMNNWLHNYEYRTGISLWIFLVGGLTAMAITLLSVSYQAIRAASRNPMKSLRSE
jgi:putative ABC transport system permease protein